MIVSEMRTHVLALKEENLEVVVDEDTEILGLYVGHNNERYKGKLRIVHTHPGIRSRVLIKAVVYDLAKFDLEAMLIIERGAEEVDTYLKLAALIVDEGASARAVPGLEIKSDNVQAGHGATVGMLDIEQLTYLMARGLSRTSAENLLIEAFIQDVKTKIENAEKN